MPSYQTELLKAARAVARLQARRRFLRRELKKVQKELTVERKHLRALANANDERPPDVVPSPLFGGSVGYQRKHGTDE